MLDTGGFVGQKFGEGEHLVVIGIEDKRGNSRSIMYRVLCCVCAMDGELFGNGVFLSTKDNLKRGSIPCGCSKCPKWTKDQYTIKIQRRCTDRKILFNGFVGDWFGGDTKISLTGTTDGVTTEYTTIDNLLSKRALKAIYSDDRKGRVNRKGGITKSDESMSESFMSAGTFHAGTKFWRVSSSGKEQLWAMTCPLCSSDKYVVAGVCSGVFTSVAGSLQQGLFPCRCSSQFRWSQQQRELQIKSELLKEGASAEFTGWLEPYIGCESRAVIRCKDHGTWDASISSLINTGSRCPRCAKTGFDTSRPASLYILKIASPSGDFTGYGISNFIGKRLATHRCTLANSGCSISEQVIFSLPCGKSIRDVEKLIKALFHRNHQNIEGFKTEATHAHLFDEVVNFAKSQINIDNMKHLQDNEVRDKIQEGPAVA